MELTLSLREIQYLTVKKSNEGQCKWNIVGLENNVKYWKIGFSMFKGYITLFDYENDEVIFNELKDYKGNLIKKNLFIKITVILLITGIVLKILILIGYKKEILIK